MGAPASQQLDQREQDVVRDGDALACWLQYAVAAFDDLAHFDPLVVLDGDHEPDRLAGVLRHRGADALLFGFLAGSPCEQGQVVDRFDSARLQFFSSFDSFIGILDGTFGTAALAGAAVSSGELRWLASPPMSGISGLG